MTMLAARLALWALAATLLLGIGGCAEQTGPSQEPPYLALIPVISAAPGTDIGTEYTYEVTELSGTLNIDKVRRVAPTDTVIVPVKPATYRVTLSGLPSSCQVQDGTQIYLVVPEGSNTTLWRFQISCESLITITAGTDGPQPDSLFVWTLTQDEAVVRSGTMAPSDTVRIDGLPSGAYTVSLVHVGGNCVVTSDGGRHQRFTVTGTGGGRAEFRVICSDPAQRPRVSRVATSYHEGTSGFLFRAADPDGDVDRYYWDITDCQGKSVLPAGGRERRGLLQGYPFGPDSAIIYGAIEVGLPDAQMQGRCTSIRVQDVNGNTTPIVEELIGNEAGPGPTASSFNAVFTSQFALATTLAVTAQDYVGYFAAATLRDGALFSPDGKRDIGIFSPGGFDSDVLIPTIPLGNGRPPYYDYYSVIVYLFDAAGNFTRIEDDELYQ